MIKNLIDKIIGNNNTVIAAEHNLNLISHSDYLLELGPEGGDKGGYLIFQGQLKEILNNRKSVTAKYMKKFLKKT